MHEQLYLKLKNESGGGVKYARAASRNEKEINRSIADKRIYTRRIYNTRCTNNETFAIFSLIKSSLVENSEITFC